MTAGKRAEVYERITATILEKLKAGVAPWHRPWNVELGVPRNFATGRPYSGVNTLVLGLSGETPYWLTYLQAQRLGWQVRRGEKGTPVLFFKLEERHATVRDPATGRLVDGVEEVPVVRVHHVFNATQVDGISPERLQVPAPRPFTPIQVAEELVASIQPAPRVHHGGGQAYFSPGRDEIRLPEPGSFARPVDYYATLFHEATHWTGHPSRLNRATLAQMGRFGDANYSKEELVAEMGAGFLCALTGISNEVIDQSASYLQSWLQRLRGDPALLVSAASQAQAAADYLTQHWQRPAPAAAGAVESEVEA